MIRLWYEIITINHPSRSEKYTLVFFIERFVARGLQLLFCDCDITRVRLVILTSIYPYEYSYQISVRRQVQGHLTIQAYTKWQKFCNKCRPDTSPCYGTVVICMFTKYAVLELMFSLSPRVWITLYAVSVAE